MHVQEYQLILQALLLSEALTLKSKKYWRLFMRSFTMSNTRHSILLNDEGKICWCSCLVMETNNLVYKHIYIASRILDHVICFQTREQSNISRNELKSVWLKSLVMLMGMMNPRRVWKYYFHKTNLFLETFGEMEGIEKKFTNQVRGKFSSMARSVENNPKPWNGWQKTSKFCIEVLII